METRRRAKCSSTKCDKDLKSGFLCLCVSGVLSVAYQTDRAVLRKFYFWPMKTCSINHKASSNFNNKVFSDFIKKEKTIYLGRSVFGRLTKCISTLAFNPNLGEEAGGGGSGVHSTTWKCFTFWKFSFFIVYIFEKT